MDLPLFYLVCLGAGFVFALASALFAEGGPGGHDLHAGPHLGHAEAGLGGHGMPGFSPLSPTTIASFIAAFGGFGLIFSRVEATSHAWISLPLAVLGGFLTAAAVFWIFSKIFRATQSSSEGRVGDLFGEIATVITPISDGGVGEIAYEQGGTRYTGCARTEESGIVPSGTKVRIVRVVGSQFYVIKD